MASRPVPKVVRVFVWPPAETAQALAMVPDELSTTVRPMALALDQYRMGDFAGMFDAAPH